MTTSLETQPSPVLHAAPKYWAFISYSHRDEVWASWLHRGLETYRVPRSLAGRKTVDGEIPKRVFPIFRDRDELPGASDLGAKIREALQQSRFLIAICSPRSAASKWVNEEIKSFKSLGREDRVLALIVDGEPNADDAPGAGSPECFPPALRYRLGGDGELTDARTEPLAADVRKGRGDKAEALLKLLAGLLGVGFDELRQREKQRRRRQRLRQAVAAALVLAAAGAAYVGLADDGLAVPWGQEIRTVLDRHDLSLFRPVRSERQVRLAAADMRTALEERLCADWNTSKWPTEIESGASGPKTVTDVWTASQAACALLRTPDLPNADRGACLEMLGAAFEPGLPIESKERVKYGWIPGHSSFTEAEPGLWTVAGLAAALGRSGLLAADRQEFEARLAYAQEAARPYLPKGSGGWHAVPNISGAEDRCCTYTTALALLALLETRAAGLPWEGSVERRDRLLFSAADWLVGQFDGQGPEPGWHADPDDKAKEVCDGLTLQIYCELLRAETEAGYAIRSPSILDAIPRHLARLTDRRYDYPHAYGRLRYRFTDHEGKPRDELIIIEFLWYPWAVDCTERWLDRARAHQAAPEDLVRLRRTLGHLVVDLAGDAGEGADPKKTGAFIASELLYALADVPRP